VDLYEIHLDNFSGPLDLLLHLIKKNEMDVYDIPMAEITGQYLSILDAMKTLNLDIAGEFLLMAASLIHVKSKMLLPKLVEESIDEEDDDPRAELVRRLLEYQKYKEVAGDIEEMPQLNRDLFARYAPEPEILEETESEFAAVGLFDLLEALQEVLKTSPEPRFHEVNLEQLSVTDRINTIMTSLQGQKSIVFNDLFVNGASRNEVIVSFLAILELVRLKMVKFMQNDRFGSIWLFPSVENDDVDNLELGEDNLGYS
jgi:segregation and condensation protein A